MKNDPINNVRRKINEVMKKHDEKIVVGWKPSYQHREEGEEWVDKEGKRWMKKNGMIQSESVLQDARMPLFCPNCEKVMNHKLDTKFWRIRNMCQVCVAKQETQMRVDGTWEEYKKNVIRNNYRAELLDRIEELKELHRTIKAPEVLLADDTKILMKETWDVDIDSVKEDIAADIEYLEDLLEKFDSGELEAQTTGVTEDE